MPVAILSVESNQTTILNTWKNIGCRTTKQTTRRHRYNQSKSRREDLSELNVFSWMLSLFWGLFSVLFPKCFVFHCLSDRCLHRFSNYFLVALSGEGGGGSDWGSAWWRTPLRRLSETLRFAKKACFYLSETYFSKLQFHSPVEQSSLRAKAVQIELKQDASGPPTRRRNEFRSLRFMPPLKEHVWGGTSEVPRLRNEVGGITWEEPLEVRSRVCKVLRGVT